MDLQQSFYGDAPRVGFGRRAITSNFPSGISWIEYTENNIRLENVTPNISGKENGVYEANGAYELQSLNFGKLAAIRSSSSYAINNGRMNGRQHDYTQIVAFPNEEGLSCADCWEPEQLVDFQNFMSVEDFWDIRSDYTPAPISWDPPAKTGRTPAVTLSEMETALLCRYWQAASRRVFPFAEIPTDTVFLTLSDAKNDTEVIEQAKNFITAVLVPGLPRSVFNILSVSAGISPKGATKCKPTALAVLLPLEAGDSSHPSVFDFRKGSFVKLSSMEANFMADMVAGKISPSLMSMYKRYCEKITPVSQAACPLMADYHVAFCAWYLDNQLHKGNVQEALQSFSTLFKLLVLSHKLTLDQAEFIASELEEKLYSTIDYQDAPYSKENFVFLLERVSRTPAPIAKKQMALLASHQRQKLAPFFLEPWPVNNTNYERLAEVLKYILFESYLENGISESVRNFLMNKGFVAYCKSQPCLHKSMEEYLVAYSKKHPDQGLFMLPLSVLFLDGYNVLGQSIRLLRAKYTENLPDKTICDSVSKSFSFLNDENKAELNQYFLDCFHAHRSNPAPLSETVRGLATDTTEALCMIFHDETQHVNTQEPLSAQQITLTMNVFGPHCTNKEAVVDAYRNMVLAVLDHSFTTGINRFPWYCETASLANMLDSRYVHFTGIKYLCQYCSAVGNIPEKAHYDTICGWLKAENLNPELQNTIKSTLETLMPASEEYARGSLNLLGSVQLFPKLRELLITMTKETVMRSWGSTGKYWSTLESAQVMMSMGNISYRELADEKTVQHARVLLQNMMSAADNRSRFHELYNAGIQHSSNPFYAYWNEALNAAFCERYNLLFADCRSLSDVTDLHEFAKTLGVIPKLQTAPAYINTLLILETQNLLHTQEPVFNNNKLLTAVLDLAKRILPQASTASYEVVVNIVTTLTEEKIAGIDFVRSCILLLLPANIRSNTMDANYFLLKRFVWDRTLTKKPFADENLEVFQKLLFVFELLDRSDVIGTNMCESMCYTLINRAPFSEYTEKVRADKANLKLCFPGVFAKKSSVKTYISQHAVRWLKD
ncbi:MAG: hypothetical protein E7331_10840 [Clostridiales bacterium]|nr:hypothetical protein [Clostridiales bacterium]